MVIVSLLLLTFLGSFYVRTTLFLSVVNTLNLVYSVSTCLIGDVRNINQIYRAVLVEAYTRFVAYFSYKQGQTYRVMW
jgi:hypothetical protein